jgi:hypothetical protein
LFNNHIPEYSVKTGNPQCRRGGGLREVNAVSDKALEVMNMLFDNRKGTV